MKIVIFQMVDKPLLYNVYFKAYGFAPRVVLNKIEL
jgi:hypothetical protein